MYALKNPSSKTGLPVEPRLPRRTSIVGVLALAFTLTLAAAPLVAVHAAQPGSDQGPRLRQAAGAALSLVPWGREIGVLVNATGKP